MKLYTRFELASKNTAQLRSLFGELFNNVAGALASNAQLRNDLASLENIRRELAARALGP